MKIWFVDCDKCGAIRIIEEADLRQDASIQLLYPEVEKGVAYTCTCGNINRLVYNPIDITLRNWRGHQHYKQLIIN